MRSLRPRHFCCVYNITKKYYFLIWGSGSCAPCSHDISVVCATLQIIIVFCFLLAATGEVQRPFWCRDLGGMQSTDKTRLYYVGIIDILTCWNTMKKVEHVARALQLVLFNSLLHSCSVLALDSRALNPKP